MKGLALETIVKWVILSVLILVVVNLMIFFSDEIKKFIKSEIGKKEWKTEIIEAKEFSTSQLVTYIIACWDRTGEKFHEDVICFILKGDVSKVDTDRLKKISLESAQVNVDKFDQTRNVTIIRFEDVGNVIVVES